MFLDFIKWPFDFSKMETTVYLKNLNTIVRWWNDHDSGVRTWTKVSASQFLAADGSASSPSYTFISASNDGFYLVGGTIGVVIGGTVVAQWTPSNGYNFLGTKTNDNASTGNVGEYFIQSVTDGSPVTPPSGSSTYFDITSITLSAGDWDVSAIPSAICSSGTCSEFIGGVSLTSGNSATGLVFGDNWVDGPGPVHASFEVSRTISGWRVSASGSTTVYLKGFLVYAGGTTSGYGRISARRVR